LYLRRKLKLLAFGYDIYNRITFYIKANHEFKNNIKLEKIDFIIYIFFIVEHVLPILKDKYNFSDQINIVIDFNKGEADAELISFIMYYLNNYYPLILGKFHVVDFDFEKLRKNISFRNELSDIDYFRVNI